MNAFYRVAFFVNWLWCLAIGGLPQLVAAEESEAPLHRQIDELVAKRLAELKITPAAASNDAEFVRRIYLDLTGVIPTAQQARLFLDDSTTDKRSRLVEQLLSGPEYAIHMARVLDTWLIERRIPTISSYDVPSSKWRTYLTRAFVEDRSWDRIARDILSSDGADENNAEGVKFYLVRDVAPHQLTRDVGRLFLGIDLQCAQCHDDPRIESYRQADYFGLYAFLQRLTAFRDNGKNVSLIGETAVGKTTFVSVFTAKNAETNPRLPGGEMIAEPTVDNDKAYIVKPGPKDRGIPTYSRRLKLADLLPRAETQGFSRNIANRVWALLMGRGIVYPLDLHHAGNPPTHPDLLVRLESWLVEHKYNLKSLIREIVLSQTYQRSSVLPDGMTKLPDEAFAVAAMRGLSPEQFSWSVFQATGRIEKLLHQVAAKAKPDDTQPAWKVRLSQLESLERQTQELIAVLAGLPGQPDGEFQPVVDQALHLLNSPKMLPLLQDEPSTLLARLAAFDKAEPLADELYLSVLSRRPLADETTQVRAMIEPLKTPAERRERLIALIWGLLLSSEFRLDH